MSSPTEPSRGPSRPDPGAAPGSVLGPFRLLAALGSGATGNVWTALLERADHGLPAGATVALKLLHPHLLDDPDALRRFEREARVAGGVRHPAVVSTLASGTLHDGARERPWLAMEIVEGQTLRDLMRDLGRLPEPLLRDLACQMAVALSAIHDAGVVHRDVKPGNVIITPDQRVRVMDLGVAVQVSDEARLTRTGMFVGTLVYASPEQFGSGPVGPASDLYSLGVMLYEACTGSQPFDAPDIRGVVRRHLEHVPRRAGEIDPAITPFFEELLAHLLEKDPASRPESARALAEILEQGERSAWWMSREQSLRAASPHGEIRRAHAAHEAPLVGREAERAALEAAVQAAAGGSGRVVVIEGEAGVGKSRLLEAFEDDILGRGDGAILLRSAHSPGEMGGAHDGLLRALLDHFGPVELRARVRRHLAPTPRLAGGLLAQVMGEPPPPGEPPLSLESLGAAACALARGLASEAPLVAWLIEDLHFASIESRSLALALARLAPSCRLVVVATSRPQGPAEVETMGALPGARRMSLPRLSPAEVVKLIAGILRSEPAAERIGGKVARRTDGNPFFILEMIREMKDRGFLQQEGDGRWRSTGDTAAFDIPSSVRDFLHGRLRDLRDDDRALLDAASVLGFQFDPDLVARVLGRKRLDVLQALAALARKTHLVVPTGTGFQFEHHQMQEIVYQEIPDVLRSEYHALIADAWRERAGLSSFDPLAIAAEDATVVAMHLLRGGRGDEGARLAPRAAGRLAERSDFDAATSISEMALAHLGPPDDDVARNRLRHEVALVLAGCHMHVGHRQREREAAALALEAADRLGEPIRRAEALRAIGSHLVVDAEHDRAIRVLEEAAAIAEAAGEKGIKARIEGPLAAAHFRLGDYEKARELNETCARVLHEIGDVAGEAVAIGQLGSVLSRMGREAESLVMSERSAELARQAGRRRIEFLSLVRCGMSLVAQGRQREARSVLERATSISAELDLVTGNADALLALASVDMHEGRLGAAREHASQAASLYAESRIKAGEVAGLDALAVVELAEGRLEECDLLIQRCVDIGIEVASAMTQGFAFLLRAQSLDLQGRADEAWRALALALEMGESVGDQTLLSHVRLEQARFLLSHRRLEEARLLLDAMPDMEPDWLRDAFRADAGQREPSGVDVPEAGSVHHRILAHAALHRATGDAMHRAAARAIAAGALVHLDAPARERAIAWGSLARWAE